MTFLGLLDWFGATGRAAGEGIPGSGTRLSVLAMELPKGITPAIAGLTVGAFVGVIGFVAVLMLFGRGNRRRRSSRRRQRLDADQVVFIPPYGTMQRETPLPPRAFEIPRPTAYAGQPLPFTPSTQLSARVFAKMGYAVETEDHRVAPNADPMLSIEVDMLDEDDLGPSETPSCRRHAGDGVDAPVPAVTVSRVVVLSEAPGPLAAAAPRAEKSEPHPLAVIKSSFALRPASIADLSFDDGETEIGETYFDEPPQPLRRTDPPKIRAIAPSGPRFPAQTPRS